MTAHPHYFDAMASTPLAPEVRDAMFKILDSKQYAGNASSTTHIYGHYARDVIEQARQEVASCFNSQPEQWTWTSGATESINLALQGIARTYHRQSKHIITFETEHPATLHTCKQLAQQGFTVNVLPVQSNGLIDLNQLEEALKTPTLLISILHVNNEIGVIQPIDAVCELAQRTQTLVHVDAAQTTGKLFLDLQKTPIHLCSISGHKVYGPKGIGALYITPEPPLRLEPMIFGGGQEHGLRSGTLPTHQIVGLGTACALAQQYYAEDTQRIQGWTDQLLSELLAHEGVRLNGDSTQRIPHVLNLTFEAYTSEYLIACLSDFAFSTSSACQSGAQRPSHVLTALGCTHREANQTIRLSLNRYTQDSEVNALKAALNSVLNSSQTSTQAS
jgi:cysteine desulfurase